MNDASEGMDNDIYYEIKENRFVKVHSRRVDRDQAEAKFMSNTFGNTKEIAFDKLDPRQKAELKHVHASTKECSTLTKGWIKLSPDTKVRCPECDEIRLAKESTELEKIQQPHDPYMPKRRDE
jgi:DNA-directed RNA polymerase subunit RPC12/RpoP